MTPVGARLTAWLHGRPDDDVLQLLFGVMLTATVAVVAFDYTQLSEAKLAEDTTAPAITGPSAQPLPPARRDGEEKRAAPASADEKLKSAMSFDLQGDGRLVATGTIEPGTAEAFAAEVGKRGGYVKTVVLHSPGGSVRDALTMGRLIRQKGFATEVENGRYCASSCPLVFAGGAERRAGPKAAIGVHQVFALSNGTSALNGSAEGMDNAQRVSAECQKYLREMGVDLEVWVHAMETPKDKLYYFKPDELAALKLTTPPAAAKPVAQSRS
jgi:hypothetical protein